MGCGRLGLVGAIAWSLVSINVASAADADGRFAGHGWAVARCPELLEVVDTEVEGERLRFVGWVAGYLTAANVYKPDTFDIAPLSPPEIIANIIVQECDQNQDAAVVEIMVAIARELEEQRLRSNRPVLELEHEGQGVRIHQEILRRTQGVLTELGFYDGGVDGQYGPRTRGGLEAFQEAAGLPVTGLPDQRTLLGLFFNVGVAEDLNGGPPAAPDAAPPTGEEGGGGGGGG